MRLTAISHSQRPPPRVPWSNGICNRFHAPGASESKDVKGEPSGASSAAFGATLDEGLLEEYGEGAEDDEDEYFAEEVRPVNQHWDIFRFSFSLWISSKKHWYSND
jgi:hypothetical protein